MAVRARVVELLDPANEVFLVGVWDDRWPKPDYRRHPSPELAPMVLCHDCPGGMIGNCEHPGKYVNPQDKKDETVEASPYGLPVETRFVQTKLSHRTDLTDDEGHPVKDTRSVDDLVSESQEVAGAVAEIKVAAGSIPAAVADKIGTEVKL